MVYLSYMKRTIGKNKKSARSKPAANPSKTGFLLEEAATGYVVPSRASHSAKIRDLSEEYNLTLSDFADIMEVTPKTLSRWKNEGAPLSTQQSDRIEILDSIFALGDKVLGSREGMKRWIHEHVFNLNGERPADLLKTEMGRRRVEESLYQIAHGTF